MELKYSGIKLQILTAATADLAIKSISRQLVSQGRINAPGAKRST